MNIIYCRTAKESQESIDNQINQCKKFLESRNMKTNEIYIDNGISAHNTESQLNNIINNLDSISSITVMNIDRLYRNITKMQDFLNLLKSKNVTLYIANEELRKNI